MDKQIITFAANEQALTRTGERHYSAHKVSYIEAHFELGQNWDGFDSVRAVWWTDFVKGISTVLNSDGVCIVPSEVLKRKAKVNVNLVGSIVDDDVVTDRLTSYPVVALCVDADTKVDGTETAEITPSQFEQFVAIVQDEVEEVTGMSAEATTLPAGSDATASYSDGVLTLGIPRGDKGETGQDGRDGEDGNGIESAVLNSDYTLTLNFTDGTSYTTTSIRGAEGNGIRSIAKTGTSGLVDTYTITFTDGTTSTFTVTNGEKGDTGDTGLTPSFSIGTVETLEPNEQATATITGTDENPVLNLGIPQGEPGVVPWDDILPQDTASGSIASFPDGTDVVPCKSLLVELEPIQSGSGTPSPDNVRPISGRTECNTYVSPTTSETDAEVYTTTLGRTVYGGTLEQVGGSLTDKMGMVDLGNLDWSLATQGFMYARNLREIIKAPSSSSDLANILCSTLESVTAISIYNGGNGIGAHINGDIRVRYDNMPTDPTAFQTAVNGIQLCYELATPQTYQLTETQINLLSGQNNVWSDGDVTVEYYADIQLYIEKMLGQ